MTDSARTYGLSLYSLASEENVDKLIYDELKAVSDIFRHNPDYISVLDTAAFSGETKNQLIDEAFKDRFHIYTINFIKILSHKRLIHSLSECIKFYEAQYRKDHNIEKVSIITAIKLSDDKKNMIAEKLSKIYKKELIPSFSSNPEVLGGMIIKFENSSVDASLKSKLGELKSLISK